MNLFQNGFVKLVLFLAIFGMSYHLCNGIRHLAWDAGYGLDLDSSYKSGYAVVATSLGICSNYINIEQYNVSAALKFQRISAIVTHYQLFFFLFTILLV